MKYLNKLASGRLVLTVAFFVASLGLMTLTSCEGGDLFKVNAPDWLSEKGGDDDAGDPEEGEDLSAQMEDVYNIGNEELTAGFFTLGKTYVVPAGQKWIAQFKLTVNPDNMYYKNFYLVLNKNEETLDGTVNEYGVIRFDNDPSKNSEWNTTSQVNPNGDELDRSLVSGNFSNSSGEDDVDASVQKMNGLVTLTVDRTDGGLVIKMTNGTLTKTYTQTTPFPKSGEQIDLACRIGVEKSLVNFLSTNIEPIGGCTSANDKQPLTLAITGVPSEVLLGTTLEEAVANVVGTVTFEEGVTKNVTAADLQFEAIPDMDNVGQKMLVAVYNKTFKGANCDKPVIASKPFAVVNELSAFTETVVVPTPLVVGAEDNSSPFWGAHSDNVKVEPKETKVVSFTNYSSCAENWNNFCVVLCRADNSEYAVVRADNYGWGDCYATCTPAMEDGRDFDVWRQAMDGAKVTAYVTNNGDGTIDVRAVMTSKDGAVYKQEYKGMKNIDPENFFFRFTVDGCHLVFDKVVGAEDNTTPFWGAHTANIKIPSHTECTVNFTNYSSCVENWNNFNIVLNDKATTTEYAVVRADNYGWGNGYAACTPAMEEGRDWAVWRTAMNGAKVSAKIVNKGDGTADIKIVMHGVDGADYTQSYTGINTIDPDNFFFRLTVDNCHLVLE